MTKFITTEKTAGKQRNEFLAELNKLFTIDHLAIKRNPDGILNTHILEYANYNEPYINTMVVIIKQGEEPIRMSHEDNVIDYLIGRYFHKYKGDNNGNNNNI